MSNAFVSNVFFFGMFYPQKSYNVAIILLPSLTFELLENTAHVLGIQSTSHLLSFTYINVILFPLALRKFQFTCEESYFWLKLFI